MRRTADLLDLWRASLVVGAILGAVIYDMEARFYSLHCGQGQGRENAECCATGRSRLSAMVGYKWAELLLIGEKLRDLGMMQ